MANRRFGGGPPNKGIGGGGFGGGHQNFGGNKLSPWQGGAGPNNNMNNSGGLLSQLSAPQAQLAIALSTLLQPQQPMNNNNPPSLLSLSTSPSFNNQDNFGPPNRFNNRGRDFRRSEPYKGRGGNSIWRDNSTRPSDSYGRSNRGNSRPNSNFKGKGGKGPFNRNNDNKTPAPNKPSVNPTTTSDEKGGANESSKVVEEEAVTCLSDDVNREEESGDTETKRDWKEEKNNVEGNVENGNESAPVESSTPGDVVKEKKPREGRYIGVPPSLLNCFVCNKSMWDGESFQNHLKGKAHKQMMDSLGQSFQITVNILRENMRLVEEKKMIELERMSRNNRAFHRQQQEPQSHCNMCDLKFLGKIIAHRKTDGHQRLKRFLHPKCGHCSQEFPSRMEWVDHRFTPEHLRKVHQVLEGRVKGEDGVPLEEDEPEQDNDPLLEESLQTEDENPILELSDDLKDLQNRLPAYKPGRSIGRECLKSSEGFYCEICVRFVEDTQSEQHLRSERHYKRFVDAAKLKYKKQTEEKEDEEKNAKKRLADSGDNESASKKVKVDDDDDVENGEGNESAKGGDEMYDPEEACKEGEVSLDTAALDEEFAEVDRLIQSTKEEPIEPQETKVKVEPEKIASPVVTPKATAPPVQQQQQQQQRGRQNIPPPAVRGGANTRARRGARK